MGELTRTKQRILRDAVRENVEIMSGRLPGRRRRRNAVVMRSARLFFFLTVPIAILTTSYVVANVAGGRSGDVPEAMLGPQEPSRRPAAIAQPVATESLAAATPQRIDPAVFPVAVRKVVLDPGHGGANLGTTNGKGLVEKELTLDIAQRVRKLLERSAYHVVMTREVDAQLSLPKRALIANEKQGDIFVSIHVNWLVTRQVRGVETYFLGPTDDPYLSAFAARENQGSGYSLADLRGLIEEIYANARMSESRRLAEAVQRSLYRSLAQRSPGIQDRGVKTAPFGVLTRTGMPAILAEVACLSHEEDAELLMTAEYRQFIAEALYEGIDSYAHGLNQRSQIGSLIHGRSGAR